ncbi:MAG: hypothetical protein M3O06_05415 [Pseudomonadota bacterium]|nr:hypothetical protein [Pseudomonadota bacterium]
MQGKAFAYFKTETNPRNGLVADKTAAGCPASIAATGLALGCYPVAVERGLMARQTAIGRTLATLRFFRDSTQGTGPDATGYRGFYYHFLDIETGRRAWQCELSSVDSAFLFAGMLMAAAYFAEDSADQREIRELTQLLVGRAEWSWLLAADGTIGHGWHPESGFIPWRWQGYCEAMIVYMLALGSPAHAVPSSAYTAWCSTYEWKRCYDIEFLYSAPLFTHQLSHVWIDFRGIQDAPMAARGIDYFENSRRATLVQQRYAIDNPARFKGYCAHSWGVTASDGPGPVTATIDGVERRFFGYEGRGAPFGLDDGTLSPWAVVASLPFAPEIVMPTVDHFIHGLQLHVRHAYGFKASFNQTFAARCDEMSTDGWVSPYFFGLNLGPIVLMVENFRSGLPWRLMRDCPCIVEGLRRAGFAGGWLGAVSGS